MDGLRTTTFAEDTPLARDRPFPRPALPRSTVRTGIRIVEQAVANAMHGGRD